jgi:hypothetical protein
MSGLQPATQYYYRVGNALAGAAAPTYSQVFSFRSQASPETLRLPQYHLLFGDMGASFAFTLCTACTGDATCDAATCATAKNKSVGLLAEVNSGKVDMMLQTGDFAYNLDSGGGTVGDQFFRNVEQIAARVPFMVSHGNHENGDTALAHYTERFRLLPSNSGTTKSKQGEAPNRCCPSRMPLAHATAPHFTSTLALFPLHQAPPPPRSTPQLVLLVERGFGALCRRLY